ncbi:Uncharacterized protein FKW44_006472 [Caligus rogercresseyi]|uniref:Uncharacterized protein n=1 Tax=Caligus rogercresseyi TaxID=217165 RepID=A0A7T8KDG5_CALRO|nr:Uncharacterized protein FKW44_006472 [Caligus rogercresseyi]
MKFPRPSDSDFLLDDIIYHSISKEHILNYHLLSSKTTYEPFPVLDPTSRYCFICNKLPDLDHHLTAAHQNGLRSMSKYIHFSVFKGFNPSPAT